MTEERTSLEKLQAIDKDYSTFDSQLKALKNILGITSDLSNPWSYTSIPVDALPKRRAQGRASFALRWLLNKLQSISDARLLPESWTVLCVIVVTLSPHTSTKLLLSAKFIDTVGKTLQDAFPSIGAAELQVVNAGNVDLPSRDGPGSQSEEGMGNRRERKRKRTGDTTSASRIKRRRSSDCSAQHVVDLPPAILLIDALSFCLKHVGDTSIQNTFTRSPLKTDAEAASKILGIWIIALGEHKIRPSPFAQEDASSLLDPVMRIWQCRASSASPSEEATLFSKDVLLPASRLLSSLYKASSYRHSQQRQIDHNAALVDIERLIARHIFLPARATFQESAASTSAVSLRTLLDPIKKLHSKIDAHEDSSRHDFLHVLFSIAIRCSPRSSTRKMLSEQPWLEHVFEVLMRTLPKSGPGRHLEKLLAIAKRYEVKFSREFLRSLVSDYGNLSIDDQVPRWRLISNIIALDPQALLPNSTKAGNDPLQLDQLLTAVTRHTPVLQHPLTPQYPRQGRVLPHDRDELFALIKDDIVKPLMQAHSRFRDLKGFLHLWHRCLRESFTEDNAKDAKRRPPFSVTIWEHEGLTTTLSDFLETSITSKTLSEVATGFADDISVSELEPDNHSQCYASAITLRSIFQSCRSDEYISALLPVAQQLAAKSFDPIFAGTIASSKLKQVLWRLAATSFCLWSSIAGYADIEASPLLAPGSTSLVQDLDKLSSIEENFVALASLISMYRVVVSSRHFQCKDIENGIKSSLASVLQQEPSTLEEEHVFASIISAFPPLLEVKGLSKDTRISMLRRIFFAAKMHESLVSIWLNLTRRLAGTPYHQDVLRVLDQLDMDDAIGLIDFSKLRLLTSAELEAHTQRAGVGGPEPKANGQAAVSDSLLMGLDESQRTEHIATTVEQLRASITTSSQNSKDWRTLYRLLASTCQPGRQHLLTAASAAIIIDGLAECLPQATTWLVFNNITSILTVMLIHHGRLISQFSIESIISAVYLVSIASIGKTQETQLREHAGRVYTSLCRLTQTLIALHRRKLAGRLDVLVPALQSLLRCLFIAPQGGRLPAFTAEQPSWLQGRSLEVKHAAPYTRLLTTIFDPTPSSVAPPNSKSRSSTSANLVDYTLRARRTAGQYAPYILLSLCQLQLDGRFADDSMREILMPGICVLFDCMGLVDSGRGDDRDSRNRGRNGKRTGLVDVVHEDAGGVWGVNAAQRTVLRGWWVDWERR